jgi:DNA gyrase/topoisomerase IV subunit A
VEEHKEFEDRVKGARIEIKALPEGARNITFLMRKEYRNSHSQNPSILYKRSIESFYPASGAPKYKDHFLKFNWGMIRTSNFEEIAFLDMHPKWFVREANRELTKEEKMARQIEELKVEKAKLESQLAEKKEPEEIFTDEMKKTQEKFEKRNKKAIEKRKAKENGVEPKTDAGKECPAESPDIEQ